MDNDYFLENPELLRRKLTNFEETLKQNNLSDQYRLIINDLRRKINPSGGKRRRTKRRNRRRSRRN